MNLLKTILFLLLIITGCTHLGVVDNPSPSLNIDVEQSYFSNGNIEYEAEFVNGKLDGFTRVWLEDGTLISESEYSNDQAHGLWIKYHLLGSIKYKVRYEYGKKHGYERWFYENGQVKSEQQFLHGQPEKEITRWKPDGTLVY